MTLSKFRTALLSLPWFFIALMTFHQASAFAADRDRLSAEFADPGPEYRGKPFWAWNGELKQEELNRQIRVLKQMGMGGFFMHSRTGLNTEYLSDEWFGLINASADEGARRGMEAWLYDEDRWPSGTAGGLVTKNPKYRMKFLNLHMMPAAGFHWQEGALASFACDVDGTSFTACTRLTSAGQSPPPGTTALVFAVEEAEKSSFYNGYTDVDRLSLEATTEFLKLTHEQYKAHSGDRFGKSIQGIFTDEPHRGFVLSTNGKPMVPWTESLPVRFHERFGYDLTDRLPELFLYKDGQRIAPVKWQYMELAQSMFLENWARPIRDWCRANGLIFTGHVLHEDSLTAQAVPQGSLMRFYEFEDYPGVDVLTEGNRNYWIVKQLASVARQLGQKRLLSELYGVTGWQFNFESHKYVGDWQALFGINLRCHHLAWYTMGGEAKRDYPASIFFQSAWWRDYKFVEDYYARLNLMLAQGEPVRDVLVLNPVESVWAQIGIGWAEGLDARAPEVKALEQAYREMFHWLAGSHIDFDYGDEEMVGRLSRVERDPEDHAVLWVGRARYRVVVVPRMANIRSGTLKLLTEFQRAGGEIVFAGEPPSYVDAVPSTSASELAAKAHKVAWESEAVANACRKSIQTPVEILDTETGKQIGEVFYQLRADGPRKVIAVMNMDREKWFRHATLRIKATGSVSEWDCADGRRYALPARTNGGWTEWAVEFPPIGEHLFILGDGPANLQKKPSLKEVSRKLLTGPFEYKLSEPNVLVLDMASFRINGGPWSSNTEILKLDRVARKSLGLPFRGGDMVQPWFSRKFEPAPQVVGKVEMVFEFQAQDLPEGPITLAIEEPQNFHIVLNGRMVEPGGVKGWWVDPAIKIIPLPPGAVIKGTNKLEVATDFRKDVNLEAIYLLGKFGVRVDGTQKTLLFLPPKLKPTDLVSQGLPFYSGAVTYRIPASAKPSGNQRVFVETPKFEAACIKVHDGTRNAPRMIVWQPYRAELTTDGKGPVELEVVLTRRNTFGPLHLLPMRSDAYGPDHFITEGKAWSQDYQLYPAGLLEAPVISVSESTE